MRRWRRITRLPFGGTMFKDSPTFTSVSVNDLQKARSFYREILGLNVVEQPEGLAVSLGAGGRLFIYRSPTMLLRRSRS